MCNIYIYIPHALARLQTSILLDSMACQCLALDDFFSALVHKITTYMYMCGKFDSKMYSLKLIKTHVNNRLILTASCFLP